MTEEQTRGTDFLMKTLRQSLIDAVQRGLRKRYSKEIVEVLDPFRDMQRLLHKFAVRGIIDGGAYHGEIALRLAGIFPAATVFAFEPAPRAFEVLKQRVRATPRIRSVNLGLSLEACSRTLYVNAQDSANSLSPVAAAGQKYQSWQTANLGTEEVRLVSLDEWGDANAVGPIDILKLDLQGHELEALRGSVRYLKSTVRLIYTEVEFVRIYQENCLYFEIEQFLRPLGYELYQLYNLTRGDDGQLVCGDAIFVSRERMG
jgi:FkbM family methyltransferase